MIKVEEGERKGRGDVKMVCRKITEKEYSRMEEGNVEREGKGEWDAMMGEGRETKGY